MKTPDRYTKFPEKKNPNKAGTYMYTMSMWEPPLSPDYEKDEWLDLKS